MDIAGQDLVIETPISPETQRSLMLSYLRALWPLGVLEEDEGLAFFSEDGECLSFFFYENPEAKESWETFGRTDENAAKMVMVCPNEGELTVVHEGLDEDEILDNFMMNRGFL